jgi:hypothetical protein
VGPTDETRERNVKKDVFRLIELIAPSTADNQTSATNPQ